MKIVFATNNNNKLKEVQALMPKGIELLSLKDIGCDEEIEETSLTLEGNAKIKSDHIKINYGYDCFADDTGLEVEVLNGKPGVFSARFAGSEATSEENMNKLLHKLEGKLNRRAQFRTVISLFINGEQQYFDGICKGQIEQKKSGEQGFGYDPIFTPEGYSRTFADMNQEEKGLISHRAIAIEKLIQFLRGSDQNKAV